MEQIAARSRRNDSQAGDGVAIEAFAVVAVTHRKRIFRYLLASLRDADLAETLTQECFLRAHRNWLRFRGDSSVMTWLMRIAVNLQRDYWRNRRMQFWRQIYTNPIDLCEASDWLPGGETSPEERLMARERIRKVWKVVEGLSERQRTVFLLRYAEDLEISEIARTTGLRGSSVKVHLRRAVSRVRSELGGGVEPRKTISGPQPNSTESSRTSSAA